MCPSDFCGFANKDTSTIIMIDNHVYSSEERESIHKRFEGIDFLDDGDSQEISKSITKILSYVVKEEFIFYKFIDFETEQSVFLTLNFGLETRDRNISVMIRQRKKEINLANIFIWASLADIVLEEEKLQIILPSTLSN